MILEFDWDPAKAAGNAKKHGIAFEDAMTLFDDPLARSILDRDSDVVEERWITVGHGRSGILVVVHTYEDVDEHHAMIRIISARRASRSEARQYREDNLS